MGRNAAQAAPTGYYVYELIDPRNDEAFYIGKGKGLRAWSHERDARRGRGPNALKRERLSQIRCAGLRVAIRIVQEGMTEDAALRLERQMIVRNHEKLTNVSLTNRTPLECVAAACRESLAQVKPLCELVREGASGDRLRAWVRVTSGLARVRADASAPV